MAEPHANALADYDARIAFVMELAGRLHRYGTTFVASDTKGNFFIGDRGLSRIIRVGEINDIYADRGRIIAEGSPLELKQQAGRASLVVTVADAADLESARALLARTGADVPHAAVPWPAGPAGAVLLAALVALYGRLPGAFLPTEDQGYLITDI